MSRERKNAYLSDFYQHSPDLMKSMLFLSFSNRDNSFEISHIHFSFSLALRYLARGVARNHYSHGKIQTTFPLIRITPHYTIFTLIQKVTIFSLYLSANPNCSIIVLILAWFKCKNIIKILTLADVNTAFILIILLKNCPCNPNSNIYSIFYMFINVVMNSQYLVKLWKLSIIRVLLKFQKLSSLAILLFQISKYQEKNKNPQGANQSL